MRERVKRPSDLINVQPFKVHDKNAHFGVIGRFFGGGGWVD